jgi:proline dehydrogenase
MEKIMKNMFLYLSKHKKATELARKHGLKFGATRFVSGETLESAIEVSKKLNAKNIQTTLDHLGEFVLTKEEALDATNDCINTLKAIHEHQINSNLSLKLTQIGLDLSEELCLENMKKILEIAKETTNFVRIDMEDYSRNEKTLRIFKELKKEYTDHVGVVIQAYLYKSIDDVKNLGEMKSNLRLCKGAYKESETVAFREKKEVDTQYLNMIKTHLKNGHYAGIATHDKEIIKKVIEFVKEENIPTSQFEFQMLYGIQNDLLESLAKQGYRTRIYLPYGTDWYGYFMRRLAERPANVWFVLKNMKKSK